MGNIPRRAVGSPFQSSRRGESSLTPWDLSASAEDASLLPMNNPDSRFVGPAATQKGSLVNKGYTGRHKSRHSNMRSREPPTT